MNNQRLIDTDRFSAELRKRGVDSVEKRILLTRFPGTLQEKDITLPLNSDGLGRVHHFNRNQGPRWPANPLPIDPAAHWLGTPLERETVQVQVYQNAVCSWRCWYCYVDFDLLSGNLKTSRFVGAEELVDLYLNTTPRVPIVDLSGGQPDLVPEWTLWMADELARRGLERSVFLWSDDNLSNDYLWRFLSASEIDRLAAYKFYARVGCFKGFDPSSFSFNTKAQPDMFARQFVLMRRLVDAGFDVYGYVTLTAESSIGIDSKMREFVDRLQAEVHPCFPLRIVPLRIKEFTPTSTRMDAIRTNALEVQYEAVEAWCGELQNRFSRAELSRPIYEHRMGTRD